MEIKNNEMERLYAETFHRIEEGSILKGKVIAVKQEGAIIDIGYKADGFVPAEEFSPEEFSNLQEGAALEVYVYTMKYSNGMVNLSRKAANRIKAWDIIESAMGKGDALEGVISGKTKGGLSVDILGVTAFLPGSQIDVRVVRDMDSLISKRMLFKVLKLNNKRSNVIVSHRAVMEEEREKKKIETLEKLKEGVLLTGTVKNITDYGVFIDLGGLDGLLHISDISWGRITHPSEFFAIGDEIEVIVLKFDEEQKRVTLGYKQKKPDPWSTIDEKYPAGQKIKGNVVNITEYGVFIELEKGLEGLVHISEIDWLPKPKHPSKYLSIGETVEAVILKADKNDRRLSLSIKQLKPSPWELVSHRYSAGQQITGKVKSITDFGVFVGLPEGVDGLIHISDISWTKHIKHPSEVIKKGQKIDAVVLSIEPEKERIALGVKQLTPDPWLTDIPARFKLGDEVKSKVLRLTDFGIFVEIEDEVEGLIYTSEIVKAEEPLKEGDIVWTRIIKIDLEERKIGLSMKNVKKGAE
ncbi:MAG: 30S ribosomal protein S1 [Thermodesulfovibrionales bacterium]|nr:30S ribosomal protein S1 [Thermodesulfovibrionales bacterium]